jgi:hypothetical protein
MTAKLPHIRSRRGAAARAADPSGPFAPVAHAFALDRRVVYGGVKGFGSGALKVDGKIFAMISSKGQFVAKLPAERVEELIRDGKGQYFDAGRGKKMKEWLALADMPGLWIELAKEARQFVGTK